MAFDPKAYVAKQDTVPSKKFDPKAYAADSSQPVIKPNAPPTLGNQIVRGALDVAPVAGAVGGGMVAGPFGAAAGGFVGKSLQQVGQTFLGDRPEAKSVVEALKEPVIEGAKSAAWSSLGPIAGKLAPMAAELPMVAQGIDKAKGLIQAGSQMAQKAAPVVVPIAKGAAKVIPAVMGYKHGGGGGMAAGILSQQAIEQAAPVLKQAGIKTAEQFQKFIATPQGQQFMLQIGGRGLLNAPKALASEE